MFWKIGAKSYRRTYIRMTLWYIFTLFVSFLIIGAFILAYYISLIALEFLAANKTFPSYLAGLDPAFLFGCLGIYLLIKAAKEYSFKPIAWLTEALDFIRREWKRMAEDV